MRRTLNWLALIALVLFGTAVYSAAQACDTYTYSEFSVYMDDWVATWGFLGTISGPELDQFGWGPHIDQTIVYGDCDDRCSYTGHTVASFSGGNQWWGNVGGQNFAFRQISAAYDGTTLAVDYNGAMYVFDAFDQSWQVIPGWLDASGSIAASDSDHVYALQPGGYLYHFNNSTRSWDLLSGATNIVKIFAPGTYGLDSAGAPQVWDGTQWISYLGLTYPPMSQLVIGSSGELAVSGISTNVLYSAVWGGSSFQWVVVPTPFTPVNIAAASNAMMALDNAGNLWTMTSAHINDDPYPTISATWLQTTQLPSGLNQIAVGGPSDVYAFGPGQYVHRFFPNSTVAVDDYVAIDTLNSIGVIPANLPDGSQFSGSGTASVIRRCRPAYVPVTILSYGDFWGSGNSRYKVKAVFDNGIVEGYGGDLKTLQPARSCNVISWCSNTTDPMGFRPILEDYVEPNVTCQEPTSNERPYFNCFVPWIKLGFYIFSYHCRGTKQSDKPVCTTWP